MTSAATLDSVWQSGYCDETVRNTAENEDREARVEWLKRHVQECDECEAAARIKDLEARVAKAMGCFDLFDKGGDVSKMPGFSDAFASQFRKAMAEGRIDPATMLWMQTIARERAGKPWPGRVA